MKILLLCNKSPYPPSEGGPIAMNMMIEGLLAAGHQVKIIALNSYKYNTDINSIPSSYRSSTDIELVYTNLRLNPIKALGCFVRNESYHLYRFAKGSWLMNVETLLKKESFDVVQLETLFMAPAIPIIKRLSKAKIVLRAHNIEHLIWQRTAAATKNPLKKLYLLQLASSLRKYELDVFRRVDGVAAITPADALFVTKAVPDTPVVSIPFGVDTTLVQPSDGEIPETLYHIGSMDWIPNMEGIRWLLNEVWPLILKEYPVAQLHLAGRNMPDWLINVKMEGVTIHGEVASAIDFIEENGIMVVPLLSGSGIRIKIIEAMTLGRPVLTTSIGAEGIGYTEGHELAIADTAALFAEKALDLIRNQEKRTLMGREARQLITSQHHRPKLIVHLESFYRSLIKK